MKTVKLPDKRKKKTTKFFSNQYFMIHEQAECMGRLT